MNVEVWRVVKSKYADSAFDGEGARLFGGRWNGIGTPMIYAAQSASLALLELLVHLGTASTLHYYSLFRARIEETDVLAPAVENLPPSWTEQTAARVTQEFGDAWAERSESLALRVPSVVVPMEHNVLVNPRHPAFDRLEIEPPLTLPLDPRLISST